MNDKERMKAIDKNKILHIDPVTKKWVRVELPYDDYAYLYAKAKLADHLNEKENQNHDSLSTNI